MSALTSPDVFDVFVSYHSGDGEWVTALAADLESRGLTVWLDRDQIRPGDLFIRNLEEALAKVRCVVVVVSPGSLRSAWVQEEFHRTLTLINTTAVGRRLIPILIDDAEPPGFLANRDWVDFRDSARRAANLDRLIFGITGRREGAAGAGSVSDYLRRDTPATTEGGIDEVAFLTRQIERARVDARRFQRTRLLALVPGLAIFGAFWAFAQQPPGMALAGVLVGAPLITELIAWSVTAAPLAQCERKLEKYEMLRDGLEMCRMRTGPGCKTLREKFWEIVLRQTSDLAALSRVEG